MTRQSSPGSGRRTERDGTAGLIDVPRGLAGVAVAETRLGDVRGDEGFYHYREYSATELAERRSFEDVWFLTLHGRLPDGPEAERFRREVAGARRLGPRTREALPALVAAMPGAEPMDVLRAALPVAAAEAGLRPLIDVGPDARRRDAVTVAAQVPALLAGIHHLQQGRPLPESRADLGHAADYLQLLTGAEPVRQSARALEHYLVATIDHGFNASTFTARVVASTGADLAAAVTAALGALSGPLHGGAPGRALDALDRIGSADRAEPWVRAELAAGRRIMGFGHPVYRTDDPRSVLLRSVARHLAGDAEARALVTLAEEVEREVVRVLSAHKPDRPLRANVEYYAGVVMSLCGIPRSMFTPTFAVSRVVGWCANIDEQAADTKIIRPGARYVGPPAPQPVPAAEY